MEEFFQNKKLVRFVVFSTFFLVLLVGTIFTVDQREQALVLQFGEPVRLIKSPGLKFKLPFLQNVVLLAQPLVGL